MLALITARLKATNTNADGKVDPGELKALTGALLLVELRTGIVSPAEDTDDCSSIFGSARLQQIKCKHRGGSALGFAEGAAAAAAVGLRVAADPASAGAVFAALRRLQQARRW